MKYNVNVNQKAIFDLGLQNEVDFLDLIIYDFIIDFMLSDKCIKMIVGGTPYFLLKAKLIIENLPLLNIRTERGINQRIDKLIKCGLLERCNENKTLRQPFYKVGDKYYEYKFATRNETSKQLGTKIPSTRNENSKNNIYNSLYDKENIKEKEDNKLSSIKENANELDFSIVAPEFMECVNTWLAYKKEKKQTYKPKGFVVFYKKLAADSNNNPIVAAKMIENSMANNYAGVFKLKDSELKSLHTTQKTLFDKQTQTDEELLQQFYENTTIAKEAEIYGVQDPYWFRQLNDQQLAYWRKQYKQKLLEWIKQNGNK